MATATNSPTGHEPAGLYGPHHVGVYAAVRRHPTLAITPVLVLLVLALLIAAIRTPTYTAEARVSVGRIDVSEPGALSGFANATQALADAYSRAINGESVVSTVARRVGADPATVRASLSASPFPESSVIRVVAAAKSEDGAIALANTGSDALVAYVDELNRSNPGSARLFKRFKEATVRLEVARDRLSEVSSARRNQGANTPQEREAKAALQAEDLRVDVLREAYQTSQGGQAVTSLLQVLSRARDAQSDRVRIAQGLAFTGLLLGGVFGVALATLQANRQVRRARAFAG